MTTALRFHVLDTQTGRPPNLERIALTEYWARKYLMYCDMKGFAIAEDGTLILTDGCGNWVCCPEGRFQVVMERGRKRR